MTNANSRKGSDCDVPILEVRDLLRRFPHVVRSDCFEKAGYSSARRKDCPCSYDKGGTLKPVPTTILKMTQPAKALHAAGSAARRRQRETAEAALDEVICRRAVFFSANCMKIS